MASDAIEDRLRNVLSQVLKLPRESIGLGSSRKNLAQWDSLNHLNLMLALEDEFGVEFSDNEIASIDSLRSLAETLRGRQN